MRVGCWCPTRVGTEGQRRTDGIGADADGCDLGDERLNARDRLLLDRLGDQPGRSIPAACRGEAEVDAAYRFLDNPKVTPDKLLAPHRAAAAVRRMAAEPVVVVAQGTTEIDLTRPTRVVGGPLADDRRCGFHSHTLLALTAAGVPLGVPADHTWARDPDTVGRSKHDRKRKPLADKESVRWVDGYRTGCEAARAVPGVEVVCVSDGEGDLYEAFVAAEEEGHAARFVVRACQDRRLAGAEVQFLFAAAAPALATRVVGVSARVANPSETRTRRKARGERLAVLTIRAVTLTPRAPWRPDGTLPAVAVTAVTAVPAREENPPPGEEAIAWRLLTDLPAGTAAEAERVLDLDTVRWQIEVHFRVLKSGCGVEKWQWETAERVLNALAVYRVVAWRVLMLTMLGRSCPELACEAVLSASEWKAVYVVVTGKPVPTAVPSLGVMVRLIARLGGYLDREGDPPPGPEAMWVGLQKARTLALAWDTFGPGAKTCAE